MDTTGGHDREHLTVAGGHSRECVPVFPSTSNRRLPPIRALKHGRLSALSTMQALGGGDVCPRRRDSSMLFDRVTEVSFFPVSTSMARRTSRESTSWTRRRSCPRSWRRSSRSVCSPSTRIRRATPPRPNRPLPPRPPRPRHRRHERPAASGPPVLLPRHPAHPARWPRLRPAADQPHPRPVNDMLRAGMRRTAVHRGVAPYRPNSLDGGCPGMAAGRPDRRRRTPDLDGIRSVRQSSPGHRHGPPRHRPGPTAPPAMRLRPRTACPACRPITGPGSGSLRPSDIGPCGPGSRIVPGPRASGAPRRT